MASALPLAMQTITMRSVANSTSVQGGDSSPVQGGETDPPGIPPYAASYAPDLATCTAEDLALAFARARDAVATARHAADRALLFASLLAR